MKLKTNRMHVSELKLGDTLLIKGELVTVSKGHLRHCPFMGTSYKGDASVKYYDRVALNQSGCIVYEN